MLAPAIQSDKRLCADVRFSQTNTSVPAYVKLVWTTPDSHFATALDGSTTDIATVVERKGSRGSIVKLV